MPIEFVKSWFTSKPTLGPTSPSSTSPSSTSPSPLSSSKTATNQEKPIWKWAEQMATQDVGLVSNVGLLCWTIYLARHLAGRTTQEVEKSIMKRGNGITHEGSSFSTEDRDMEKDDGNHYKRSEKMTNYNLLSHVYNLIGIKEGATGVCVATLLCLRTLCDLRMIRFRHPFNTFQLSIFLTIDESYEC